MKEFQLKFKFFMISPSKFKLIASNVIPKLLINIKCISLAGT